MVPSKEMIMAVLKELPISYYLHSDIPVTLDDSDASYYDFKKKEIHISYSQLARHDIPEDKIEETVRGNLYHELSHVILSPSPQEVR